MQDDLKQLLADFDATESRLSERLDRMEARELAALAGNQPTEEP